MNDPKPWYASKTIWANVIGLVAAMSPMIIGVEIDAETQGTILAGVLAVVNIGLRAVTSKALK